MTPGLTGAGLGGSRCPYLDGMACGNLWLERKSPARDLLWVESSMRELQKHSKRSEGSLTSFWRLEPAIHRPRMQDVFNASWDKSGADPALRVGRSSDKAAIDPYYLRDMVFSLPGSVVDSALVADFDYVHTATSLGRLTEGCSCRLCVAVDAVIRPLFARNVAVGDIGNLIVSAIVSVDLSLDARAAASVKGVPVSNRYITFVPALPSQVGHPVIEGNVFSKGDGVGQVQSAEMAKIFQAFEARGIMRNTCVYSLSCAIDFFVYGGAYGGVWSMQDTQFLYDYAIGSRPDCDAELQAIRNRCVKVASGAVHKYVGDGVTLKFANYVQIKFKMKTEEAARSAGKKAPGYVVWDDLKAMCAFRCTDGVFASGLYDSRGDVTSVLILGALVAVHDFIDLGYDMASGEIGNIMSNARHRVMENAVAVPENLGFKVGWRFKGTLPGYSDLVDDSRFTQHTPE
ncbi:hypothetical protein AtubIFM55763_007192 [Aspergillus tubingensis]|uniref:uncharacterized protein n=1 Tax=Aspergillus tubingensis TaxID=5068 RepID=UPI0015784AD8|nr:uncharacterized protein AtWU_03432 [Aspergillus tubingensis]GFN13633.1 hypothetical protein AtWU_03432 [Aspergillus tubingensis]GLA61977.1 hypothetical protein AtubIFM54640_002512 [Aspergillus tubingensis]GLA75641.1 hypothetical protein AtubIFM55763_007192 [Aspergillus tubingensis]